MKRTRAFVLPVAILFALGWPVAVTQSFREPYVGMAVDRGRVGAVERGGPADAAGLRPGDRLLAPEAVAHPYRLRLGQPVPLEVLRGDRTLHLALVPTPPPASERTWRFTLALAGLCMMALGIAVFLLRPQPASSLFLWLSLLLAIMLRPSGALPAWIPAPLSEWGLQAAELFLPALLIHFVLIFPAGTPRPVGRRVLTATYAPATLLLLAVTALQLAGLSGRTLPEAALELAQVTVVLYFLAGLVTALVLFLRLFRSARTAMERSRVREAFWGMVLGLLPIALVSAVLLWVPLSRLPWIRYAGLSLLIVPAAFADATVRHRLFDFEMIVRRSLVYSTLAAFSLAMYVLLAEVAGRWLTRATHLPDLVWPASAIFLVGVLFGPLRDWLGTAVDRLYLQGRYDYRGEILKLTAAMAQQSGAEAMRRHGLPALARALDLRQLAYFQMNGGTRMKVAQSLTPLGAELAELEVPEDSALAQCEEARPWDLDTSAWSGLGDRARRSLDRMGATALVPIRVAGQLDGLWVLGPRPGHEWFEPADLALLSNLGGQCGQRLTREHMKAETEAHAHLRRELQVAHDLQRMLIPAVAPIFPTLDIGTHSVSCEEVGGDYFDFVPQGEDRFGFVVADSTGKGVPAALLMAGLQAQFRAEAPRHPEPSELLAVLNARVQPENDPHRYVALFYATVEVEARRVRYANGGHPPPLLVHADGRTEQLTEGGMLLGVMPDSRYDEQVRQLARGDVLVFYTDGVLEQRAGDELFGEERLRRLVIRHRHQRAQRLVHAVVEAVQAFGSQPIQDDLTVVVMKFL